jgi:glycosyltransferase involved in cell wall biosynthesis
MANSYQNTATISTKTLPNCSLIICTYNRVELLKECLDSVFKMHEHTLKLYPKFKLQIIIVNDASSDDTREFLEASKVPLSLIHHSQNRGVSEARNSGIEASIHKILAFTDDDCTVDKNWLIELLKPFSNSDFVFGKTHYRTIPSEKNSHSPPYHARRMQKHFFPERIVNNQNGKWPGGGNIAYKKAVFEKSGGFNSIYEAFYNEDTEMAIRALSQNFNYAKASKALVIHQASLWTSKSLLKSAKNTSVWPLLQKTYPHHFNTFGTPIKTRHHIHPKDFLYLLTAPILIPLLFLRFLKNWSQIRRNILSIKNTSETISKVQSLSPLKAFLWGIKLFFTKWPLYFLWRRIQISKVILK